MGFCPQLGGVGPCPAQCIWQGSGFAADQTNAMLAVVRADDESLVPPQAAGLALSGARPLPTETASLGFGGSPVGGGDKNSHFTFFRHFYVGGVSLPSGRFVCVGTTRRGVYFSRKNGFLRVGALRRRTLCSLLHTVLFRRSCMGSGITTLGVRFMPLKRWTPERTTNPASRAVCGNQLSAGTHATLAPNRAHSGSHAETRRVLRVDGDDVSGNGIIDPIDPFQADQTVAVALAEGHRNAVSP